MKYTAKPGDVVRHGPSNEKWVVAYADVERDEIAWFGWPPSYAKLSDCELLESVSIDKSLKAIVDWAKKGQRERDGHDHRVSYAKRMLREAGLVIAPPVEQGE